MCRVTFILSYHICLPFILYYLEMLHVLPKLSHQTTNDEGPTLTGENYVVLHARKCQFDAIYNLV